MGYILPCRMEWNNVFVQSKCTFYSDLKVLLEINTDIFPNDNLKINIPGIIFASDVGLKADLYIIEKIYALDLDKLHIISPCPFPMSILIVNPIDQLDVTMPIAFSTEVLLEKNLKITLELTDGSQFQNSVFFLNMFQFGLSKFKVPNVAEPAYNNYEGSYLFVEVDFLKTKSAFAIITLENLEINFPFKVDWKHIFNIDIAFFFYKGLVKKYQSITIPMDVSKLLKSIYKNY